MGPSWILVLAFAVSALAENTRLKEAFSWKTVEYVFPKASDRDDAISSGAFVPENNLPLGLDVWRDKLFITVPRWKSGVVSSLNYIDISGVEIGMSSDEVMVEEPTPIIEVEPPEEAEEEEEAGEDEPDLEEGEDPEDIEDPEDAEEDPDDDGPLDGVLDVVGDATAPVTDLVGGLLPGGGSDEDGPLDGVLDTVGDVTAPVTDLVGGLLPGGGSDEDGPLDGVLDTVGDVTAPVTDLVGGLLPGGGSDEDGPLDGVLDTVGDATAPVTDLVGGLLPGGGSDEDGPLDGVLDAVGDATAPVTDLVGGLLPGGSDEDGPLDGVLDTVGDATAPVTDLVGGLLPGGGSDEDGPLDGVLDTVGDATAPVTDLVGGLLPGGDSDEAPLAAVGDLASPVTDLVGGVTDVLPGPVGDLVSGATGPVNDLLGIDDDEDEDEADEQEEGEAEEEPEKEEVAPPPPPEEPENEEVTLVPPPEEPETEEEESDEEEDSDEETEEDDEEEEETGRGMLGSKTSESMGRKKYQRIVKRSIIECEEGDEICAANEVNALIRKSKSKKSRVSKNADSGDKTSKGTKATKNDELMKTPKKKKKSKQISESVTEVSLSAKTEKPESSKADAKKKTKAEKNVNSGKKNSKSKKAKDSSKIKKSKASKDDANKKDSVDKNCRETGDNPCGKPVPSPIYAISTLDPPKKDQGKDKKKKNKKNCKKPKKPKKPKKNCVKPPKITATSPALIPYPSLEANTPVKDVSGDPRITSVFRVRVDSCDRLWVVDTGISDILGNAIEYSKPQILVYNLLDDKLVRKYQFKPEDSQENSFYANIIVDVDKAKCDEAFAYVPDLGSYAIVVYDMKKDKAWRIKHNYFHFNPLQGNYNVGGVNFQWTDGVFGIALTRPNPDGSRTAYFHALSSHSEFKVNTFILQNENEGKGSNYTEYSLVGDKGDNSQTSASFIHESTGVMFYTQVNKDAIYCWNTDKPFAPENLEEVASDSTTLVFPNDLKVDYKNNLWVLTDKLPVFLITGLDPKEVNYRIFVAPVSEAIKDTNCAP